MCDISEGIFTGVIFLADQRENYYLFGGGNKPEIIDMCDITPGNM